MEGNSVVWSSTVAAEDEECDMGDKPYYVSEENARCYRWDV